jgi:LysM repeat protein
MNCYACANEATSQCKRCGRPYCDAHGDALCAECLKPASALPSYTLYRGSLLALLVGTAFALWLLVRPPGGSDESSPVVLPQPEGATATATVEAPTSTPSRLTTPTPAGPAGGPTATATPTSREYVVQEGDTLYGIAESFKPPDKNLVDFVREIAQLNNLGDPDSAVLRPGQTLIIP